MSKIPAVIHLTCKQLEALPEANLRCLERMRELHPDWEILVYNDENMRDVMEEWPELLPVYDAFPTVIQRTDMFRVVIVYLYGGFYLDTDMYCLQPLDTLRDCEAVLGEEKTLSGEECARLGHEHALRIANYMFGSVPGFPFWKALLTEMCALGGTPVRTEDDVLNTTGPGLLTSFYHRHAARFAGMTLLRNTTHTCLNTWCKELSCHFGDYAAHLHIGSWRWEAGSRAGRVPQEKGRLLVLETYNVQQGAYDGLSAVFGNVSEMGEVMADTSGESGHTVLVCGIPFLYEKRLAPGNINVLYTTFESDRLPFFWVDSINRNYHHCIVPHAAVKAVFQRSGVRVPVHVAQQGFTRFSRSRKPEREEFRVGFLGVPVHRKNLDKLYRACKILQEGTVPHIRLAVHVSAAYDWLDMARFSDMRTDPMVCWTDGKLSPEAVSDWFASLSCYVFPSSGEGWSFTPRESLYLGVPTVISDIPVHQELADSGYCAVIRQSGREPANYGDGNTFGEWASISEADIATTLENVAAGYSRHLELAERGAVWIEDRWKNEDMRQQIQNIIDSI